MWHVAHRDIFVTSLYVNFSIGLPTPRVGIIVRSPNCRERMNSPHPVDLQGSRIKARTLSGPASKKVLVGLLAVFIVSAMVIWLGLLGWGLIEILRSIAAGIRVLWGEFF